MNNNHHTKTVEEIHGKFWGTCPECDWSTGPFTDPFDALMSWKEDHVEAQVN